MTKTHAFQRLQAQLTELIANTPPGSRLVTEPALAAQLGVSRATLREAMRTFETQGLITRRQGVGTFVVNRSQVIETGLEVLESIETLAQRMNLEVSMGELKIEQLTADEEHARVLQVDLGTPLVRIRRVINAENRPVAYLIDILPEEVLKLADLQSGFNGSVLDLLLQRGSPKLSRSLSEIRAESASSEVARALQIQRGDVMLVLSGLLCDVMEKVVAHATSYFLPGYFRFHVVRKVEMKYPNHQQSNQEGTN